MIQHLNFRLSRLLLFLLFSLCYSALLSGQNISYTPLFENTSFYKTIDVNLPVGTIDAAADVQSGGANYSFPIEIPPGTNGIMPSVSINYNSLGSNGLVGQGWSIGGMSIITRSPQTIFHDTKVKPISLDANDRFLLDGVRLQVKSGTYGNSGSTYGPDAENFSTTTLNGSGATMWFQVQTKEGIIMEYGNTSDSRFLNAAGTQVLFWRLNKVLYKDGNYIEYKYITVNNESLIDEINYTGNAAAGLLPYSKIKFNFLLRDDKNTAYELNTPIKSSYLLNSIVITADNSQAFKTYNFKYGHNYITSYLKEVQEVGANGTALNTTIFKYGDQPVGFQNSSSSVVAGQSVDLFSGDFDADGFSDILAATYAYHNGSYKYHTGFKIYKRTATSSVFSLAYTETFPSGELWQIVNQNNTPKNHTFFASDFSGDGRDDIMINKLGYTSTGGYKVEYFKLYTSTSTGTSSCTFTTSQTNPPNVTSGCTGTYDRFAAAYGDGQYFFPGDYDGDGATDYVTILSSGTGFKVFITFPRTGVSNKEIANVNTGCYTGGVWVHGNYHHVIDFNGDGKSELMLTKESESKIFSFDPSGSNWVATQLYAAGYPTKWHMMYFGDFNGDRKTDILARTSTSNNNATWYESISTGTGFVETQFTFNHTPDITGSYSDDKLVLADFNGDGKTDIFHGWNYFVGGSSTSSKLDLYYSKGDNFYYTQHTGTPLLGFVPLIVYDLNGDGRADLVNRNHYLDPFDIFYLRKEGQEQLLQKVKNGFDHDIEFTYKRLTQTSGFYTRTAISAHPVNNLQLPIYFVSQFKSENGIGGFATIDYTYEDVKLHKEGKGFLGTAKVSLLDQPTGMKTVSETEFNTTFHVAAPYRTSVYLNATNTLLQQTTLTNQFIEQVAGSKRIWTRVNVANSSLPFENRTASSTNTYDTYGNVTQNVSTNSGVESVTTTTTFTGTPVPYLPASTTVSKTRTGQTAYATTTTFAYNSIGQMTSKTDFSGLPQSVTTTFAFNNLGNQTTTTVTPSGLAARTTTKAYDAKGRFVISTTNPLNQTASANFDTKWGRVLSETGVDGLTTSYSYDAFGRLTSTLMPTGFAVAETYGWDINATEGTVHFHQSTHPGKPDVKTWFDLLNREKKQQTEGFQNLWITTKKTYDARGNVATTTAPNKSGETLLTTTNTYDTYNRIASISNTLGTNSYAYAYNASGQLTVTVTNPAAQVSSKVTDAAGKMISATDYGGTLNYTYNSQGNLTQVKLGTTTLVTNEFDAYARQTKIIDVDAGTTQYAYNALGQMTSQISALNQTTTMVYDLLGRLTQRTGPEGTTTYEFFPSGSAASTNQLKKITGFSGTLNEYTYDAYGRISTDKVTVDATINTTSYTYNTYSEVTSVTYPSGFVVNSAYDANGYLLTLKNGNNTVTMFTNTGMNGFNQYTTYTLGNGQSSTNSYYFGMPTRYLTPGKQDLNLTWNYQSGNLTNRYDALKSRTENFTYDNLNRLLSSAGSGLQTMSVSYAANGNINTKTDAGTFSYALPAIHAVSSVTNPSLVIPTLTQNVTYTPFFQPATISEGTNLLTYTYGSDQQRIKGVLTQNGTVTSTRYYFAGYEKDVAGASTRHIHYIDNGQGLVAIVVRENGTDNYYYTYTDHIGSILTVTDNVGTVIAEQNFDPWGRRRNPTTWAYSSVPTVPAWLYRGFTGHEDLTVFNLINMNGRLYDPLTGRMLSPDNHVQVPDFSQNFNRYAYGLNNPLRFTDPDGEFFWVAFAIGAVVGAYTGYTIAKAHGYDLGDAETWGYMLGGAAIGGLTGALGAQVAAAGGFMANTSAMVFSSYSYSIGMAVLSGGMIQPSINFGVGSFNFGTGKVDFLFDGDNKWYEDLGYALGAIGNVSDILKGFNNDQVQLQTENLDKAANGGQKDVIGHSQLTDMNGKSLVDFGPTPPDGNFWKFDPGTNSWISYSSRGGRTQTIEIPDNLFNTPEVINGVNLKMIQRYGNWMDKKPGFYNFAVRSCSTQAARALTIAGVPVIGTHPYLLRFQIVNGLRPYMFNYTYIKN